MNGNGRLNFFRNALGLAAIAAVLPGRASAQTPVLAEELMTEVREAMDYLKTKVG